jgi:hypothetical protein
MFNGRSYDVIAPEPVSKSYSFDRQVIRLRASAREYNPPSRAVEQLRHTPPRRLNRKTGLITWVMDAGCVSINFFHEPAHDLTDLRIYRRGGVVIQIDSPLSLRGWGSSWA